MSERGRETNEPNEAKERNHTPLSLRLVPLRSLLFVTFTSLTGIIRRNGEN